TTKSSKNSQASSTALSLKTATRMRTHASSITHVIVGINVQKGSSDAFDLTRISRMRTELYADSRDEWKWSVSIRHAQKAGQSIFWVVMLRQTAGQHGTDRAPVAGALPDVTQFFVQERRH